MHNLLYKVNALVYLGIIMLDLALADYTCQTFLDDLEDRDGKSEGGNWGLKKIGDLKHFLKKKPIRTNWPDAMVYYQLNKTMTSFEIEELTSAIDEFHTKTCVKFEQRKEEPYVSIERNSDIQCSEASYCKSDKNFARFNTACMTKSAFIHQLGHIICLGHENQRWDRNQFVSYEKCDSKPGKMKSKKDAGIYDYSSQMHNKCGDNCLSEGGTPTVSIAPFCGQDAHTGLSVLDADKINQRYNCQGCHRHRWIPINLLTDTDKENMYSFGNVDHLGREIFPCRAFHLGEVAIGMCTHKEETCWIASKRTNTSVAVKKHVEILVIPGGLAIRSNCSKSNIDSENLYQYELVSNLGEESGENLLKDAVAGGSLILGYREYLVGYIAFGTSSSQNFGNSEELDDNMVFGVDVIGTAWKTENDAFGNAMFATGKGYPIDIDNYKILVCK